MLFSLNMERLRYHRRLIDAQTNTRAAPKSEAKELFSLMIHES